MSHFCDDCDHLHTAADITARVTDRNYVRVRYLGDYPVRLANGCVSEPWVYQWTCAACGMCGISGVHRLAILGADRHARLCRAIGLAREVSRLETDLEDAYRSHAAAVDEAADLRLRLDRAQEQSWALIGDVFEGRPS